MYWNDNTLQAFAPDAATLERARNIAFAFRWQEILGNEQILWGEYKTGVAPFYTAVHLHLPQHTCTCPSRRRPCKHVLSLLLLYLNGTDGFLVGHDYPDWVEKWLNRIKKVAIPANPDRIAEIKLPEKTLTQIQAGLAELQAWLFDLVEQGLAGALSQAPDYWDNFAARMVDAKLSGIAKRIRSCRNLKNAENAHEILLAEIAEWYLFVKGFQNMEKLPFDWQQELLAQAGATVQKKVVLAQEGIQDHWLIIAQVEKLEENLRMRRTWLLGQNTAKTVLLLDFAFGTKADFEEKWQVGKFIQATIVFYPGAYRQRALVKNFEPSSSSFAPSGFHSWEAFATSYAAALSQNPWIKPYPVLMEQIIPLKNGSQLLLVDKTGKQLPAKSPENEMWKLLAVSGGEPIKLFGEWDNQWIQPLSVITTDRIISFH